MTPDCYAKQVAAVFSKAWIVRTPDHGHSTLSGYIACQTRLAKALFDQPRATNGYACLADLGIGAEYGLGQGWLFVVPLRAAVSAGAPAKFS